MKTKKKVKIKITYNSSEWDKAYAAMSEKEKIDYWNKQVKKGEANL